MNAHGVDTRRKKRRRSPGWVPGQHGAWAMLVVPYLVATVWRALGRGAATDVVSWLGVATLFVTWMLGYFAFSAASLWLKAPARRRPTLQKPVLVYSSAAALAGLATLALEPVLALWAPVYLAVTATTLWLVHRGDERSVPSGVLTTCAAATMAVTVQAPDPFAATADQWALAAVCAAYFAGTVFYVKTLIRERGKPGWVVFSVAYHCAAVLGCLALAVVGGVGDGPVWGRGAWVALAVFFLSTVVRAAAVPLLGPMRGRAVSPKQAGIGEAVLSTVLTVLLLVI